MTEMVFGGSALNAGEISPYAWDMPYHQMRWNLTGDPSVDPGQLQGNNLATNARSYSYRSIMGGQFIFRVDYVSGDGSTVSAISLMPEFAMFDGTVFPSTSYYDQASPVLNTNGFSAPASYRPGADTVGGAASGTPITPLVMRYDRFDLPMNQVDAGQGSVAASGKPIISTIFPYPCLQPLFRWRVLVTGTPSNTVNKADTLQIYIGRGVLKAGVTFPAKATT
jgi:hypothetical protein